MPLFSRGQRPEPEALRDIPLFAGLSDDELSDVAKLAQRREVAAGEMLIDQGRVGDSFFVVAEGRALVYIGDEYVATVGPNSAVGEAALIEHRPRNASVIAESDVVVAEFGIKDFNKLLERYPTTKLRVLEMLNARVGENLSRNTD